MARDREQVQWRGSQLIILNISNLQSMSTINKAIFSPFSLTALHIGQRHTKQQTVIIIYEKKKNPSRRCANVITNFHLYPHPSSEHISACPKMQPKIYLAKRDTSPLPTILELSLHPAKSKKIYILGDVVQVRQVVASPSKKQIDPSKLVRSAVVHWPLVTSCVTELVTVGCREIVKNSWSTRA
jgi:hypothetical protein